MLTITSLTQTTVATAPVEIVERKGLGHPDTLCDGLAESLSLALSRYYLERFGVILHHNVDKGLLWGGAAQARFGGGEVLAPIEIYLAGRATREFRDVKVPVEEIAVESSRRWLRERVRHLDPERHVRIHCLIRPSSPELVDLFLRGQLHGAVPLANDTSCGAGFAPLSPIERAVLSVERHLNSTETKTHHREIGEDIKVMGVRQQRELALTVACAFVDRHVADIDDYLAKKARVQVLVREFAGTVDGISPTIAVNAADGDTAGSVYITVTGTSGEGGDDGQVGRGNRVNGLITPYRPMTIEAAAGKNPVTHVGKLYNAAAHALAQRLVTELDGIEEAYCWLVSRIGERVDRPQAVDVRLRPAAGVALPEKRIAAIVEEQIAAIGSLWRDWMSGEQRIY
jgi:S-adenosylmethionine synthetase